MADVVESKCVVCGQGSSRSDWRDKKNPACDHHTAEEVKEAIAKLTPPAVAPKPNGGAKVPPPAAPSGK